MYLGICQSQNVVKLKNRLGKQNFKDLRESVRKGEKKDLLLALAEPNVLLVHTYPALEHISFRGRERGGT